MLFKNLKSSFTYNENKNEQKGFYINLINTKLYSKIFSDLYNKSIIYSNNQNKNDCIIHYITNLYGYYILHYFYKELDINTNKIIMEHIEQNIKYILNIQYYLNTFEKLFNITYNKRNNIVITINKLISKKNNTMFIDFLYDIFFIAEFLTIYNDIDIDDYMFDNNTFNIEKMCLKYKNDNKMNFIYEEPICEEELVLYYTKKDFN